MISIQNEKLIAYLTLLSGLSISAVAVYYSVAGLASMFAAATIPVIIMGIVLELSKLVAASWLKVNWKIASTLIKTYLITAVLVLMAITSLGIFGFLSRAHLDQVAPAAEVTAQLNVVNGRIAVENQNLEFAQRTIQQLDSSVNETLSRSSTEAGALKSAQLRRSQTAERERLRREIQSTQQRIQELVTERERIASTLRSVEAEVGPIKYLATFVYGNAEPQLLEKAVTWVILLLIVVFDPLAVVLLLAAQTSFANIRNPVDQDTEPELVPEPELTVEPDKPQPDLELDVVDELPVANENNEKSILSQHPYLNTAFSHFKNLKPMVMFKEKPSVGLFVQNEEQQQSSRWSAVSTASNITSQQYLKAAQEYLKNNSL